MLETGMEFRHVNEELTNFEVSLIYRKINDKEDFRILRETFEREGDKGMLSRKDGDYIKDLYLKRRRKENDNAEYDKNAMKKLVEERYAMMKKNGVKSLSGRGKKSDIRELFH